MMQGAMVFGLIIVVLIYSYFIFRLIKNRKSPAKQGYITFMFVVCIIGIILNIIGLIGRDFTSLIGLAIQITILVGCSIQRKYYPPREDNPVGPYQGPSNY